MVEFNGLFSSSLVTPSLEAEPETPTFTPPSNTPTTNVTQRLSGDVYGAATPGVVPPQLPPIMPPIVPPLLPPVGPGGPAPEAAPLRPKAPEVPLEALVVKGNEEELEELGKEIQDAKDQVEQEKQDVEDEQKRRRNDPKRRAAQAESKAIDEEQRDIDDAKDEYDRDGNTYEEDEKKFKNLEKDYEKESQRLRNELQDAMDSGDVDAQRELRQDLTDLNRQHSQDLGDKGRWESKTAPIRAKEAALTNRRRAHEQQKLEAMTPAERQHHEAQKRMASSAQAFEDAKARLDALRGQSNPTPAQQAEIRQMEAEVNRLGNVVQAASSALGAATDAVGGKGFDYWTGMSDQDLAQRKEALGIALSSLEEAEAKLGQPNASAIATKNDLIIDLAKPLTEGRAAAEQARDSLRRNGDRMVRGRREARGYSRGIEDRQRRLRQIANQPGAADEARKLRAEIVDLEMALNELGVELEALGRENRSLVGTVQGFEKLRFNAFAIRLGELITERVTQFNFELGKAPGAESPAPNLDLQPPRQVAFPVAGGPGVPVRNLGEEQTRTALDDLRYDDVKANGFGFPPGWYAGDDLGLARERLALRRERFALELELFGDPRNPRHLGLIDNPLGDEVVYRAKLKRLEAVERRLAVLDGAQIAEASDGAVHVDRLAEQVEDAKAQLELDPKDKAAFEALVRLDAEVDAARALVRDDDGAQALPRGEDFDPARLRPEVERLRGEHEAAEEALRDPTLPAEERIELTKTVEWIESRMETLVNRAVAVVPGLAVGLPSRPEDFVALLEKQGVKDVQIVDNSPYHWVVRFMRDGRENVVESDGTIRESNGNGITETTYANGAYAREVGGDLTTTVHVDQEGHFEVRAGTFERSLDANQVAHVRDDRIVIVEEGPDGVARVDGWVDLDGYRRVQVEREGGDKRVRIGDVTRTLAEDEQITVIPGDFDRIGIGKVVHVDGQAKFVTTGFFDGTTRVDLVAGKSQARYVWPEGDRGELVFDPKILATDLELDVDPEYLDPAVARVFERSVAEMVKLNRPFANALKGGGAWVKVDGVEYRVRSMRIRDGRLHIDVETRGDANTSVSTKNYVFHPSSEGGVKVFAMGQDSISRWHFDAGFEHVTTGISHGDQFVTTGHGEDWGLAGWRVEGVPIEGVPSSPSTWEEFKKRWMETMGYIGTGASYVFSPLQTALYSIEGVLQDLIGHGVPINDFYAYSMYKGWIGENERGFARAHSVYTTRQGQIWDWLGHGLSTDEEKLDALRSVRERLTAEQYDFFVAAVTGRYHELVDRVAKSASGDAELDDFLGERTPVKTTYTELEIAQMAATVMGLANLPANFFSDGREAYKRGELVTQAANYFSGVAVVAGESYVEGFGAGAVAQLKVLAAARAGGITAQRLKRVLAAGRAVGRAERIGEVTFRALTTAERLAFMLPAGSYALDALPGLLSSDIDTRFDALDRLIELLADLLPIDAGIRRATRFISRTGRAPRVGSRRHVVPTPRGADDAPTGGSDVGSATTRVDLRSLDQMLRDWGLTVEQRMRPDPTMRPTEPLVLPPLDLNFPPDTFRDYMIAELRARAAGGRRVEGVPDASSDATFLGEVSGQVVEFKNPVDAAAAISVYEAHGLDARLVPAQAGGTGSWVAIFTDPDVSIPRDVTRADTEHRSARFRVDPDQANARATAYQRLLASGIEGRLVIDAHIHPPSGVDGIDNPGSTEQDFSPGDRDYFRELRRTMHIHPQARAWVIQGRISETPSLPGGTDVPAINYEGWRLHLEQMRLSAPDFVLGLLAEQSRMPGSADYDGWQLDPRHHTWARLLEPMDAALWARMQATIEALGGGVREVLPGELPPGATAAYDRAPEVGRPGTVLTPEGQPRPSELEAFHELYHLYRDHVRGYARQILGPAENYAEEVRAHEWTAMIGRRRGWPQAWIDASTIKANEYRGLLREELERLGLDPNAFHEMDPAFRGRLFETTPARPSAVDDPTVQSEVDDASGSAPE
ncbi:MAG: hypothetical protein RIT81_18730 [Deltaproteobacteria bacterium]